MEVFRAIPGAIAPSFGSCRQITAYANYHYLMVSPCILLCDDIQMVRVHVPVTGRIPATLQGG